MQNSASQNSADTKLHFLDYWRIIRIRKTIILAVFLLVFLTTAAVTLVLPKTFSSKVRIKVDKNTSDVSPLFERQAATPFDPYFIQTEFETIQSKLVLHKVIEELNLTDRWEERYNISNLTLQEAYQMLRGKIDVNQFRNTSVIEIRAFSRDKDEAAEIANKIAEEYKETRLDQTRKWAQNGIDTLREQLAIQTEKVKEAQDRADELRTKLKISDYVATGGGAVTTLEPETVRRYEVERIQATAQLTQAKTLLEKLRSLGPDELRKAMPTANPDPLLNELLSRQAQTQQELASMLEDRGEKNPDVQRLSALLKEINSQIEAKLQGMLTGLEARVESLQAEVKQLSDEVEQAKARDAEMTKKYRPYFIAKRELENAQRMRDALMVRVVQETVDSEIPKSSMVVVLDQAEPALKQSRPNYTLNLALGVIVGLAVGVGLAFFIEYLDTSVKTIDDVERALQAPVLGVIPQNVGSLIDEGPESPHAEAYRVLRTNLLFSRKDEKKNSLTVVSGGAGEGKSTTVFNLAVVFAQSGQRILVVDSDLRRPSLHKLLKISNSIGLTNYLLKQNSLEEVIQTTGVPTLDFLPSGKLPSSSMGILNSVRMKEFIQEAKKRYDFVFFDSPPIMGVSDASILASEVDLSLLVVQYRKYPQAMTLRAKQMVEKVGGGMMGVVLNNINISQDSYYYYYSGYYYDYYSKREDEASAKNDGQDKKEKGATEKNRLDLNKKY